MRSSRPARPPRRASRPSPARPPRAPLLLALPLLSLLPGVRPAAAAGQVIPTRVSPIVRADAFEIVPARELAMGGVTIALFDTLADPWSNPAAGARMAGARAFGSPITYDVSDRAGGGGALPMGVIGRWGSWFAAGALAVQTVEPGGPDDFAAPIPLAAEGSVAPDPEDAEPARGSQYAFALIGRAWPEAGLSVGASVAAARRQAVDGIGLLYGESAALGSEGSQATFRVGALAEWAGGSIEAVAVHARTRMDHDVTYADLIWDPATQFTTATFRDARNRDDADVWGLQVVHTVPVAEGWRVGWLVAANAASYGAVPRYDAPRDGMWNIEAGRGRARAWNLGLGVAREAGAVSWGADVVYEPIRSRIWGEDEAGAPTIENRMQWRNVVARAGAGHEWRPASEGPIRAIDLRMGVAARLMDFRLAQFDHRQAAGRDERDTRVEWAPTWGAGVRIGEVELRYNASVLYGTQRPGAAEPVFFGCIDVCVAEADIAPFPGPFPRALDPGDVTVVTQQLVVSMPVGGDR